MKISNRHKDRIFSIVMVMGMSFVISFVMTTMNSGIESEFIQYWLSGWVLSFVIAYPTILVITPVVNRIAEKLVE